MDSNKLAAKFHETYERLAPLFGYETRAETRAFDPSSANGKLMIAVCADMRATLTQQPAEQIADGALGVTQRDRAASAHLAKVVAILMARQGVPGSVEEDSFDRFFARHAQQARAQALEEAARICDGYAENAGGLQSYIQACRHNASAIRALQPHGQGGGE